MLEKNKFGKKACWGLKEKKKRNKDPRKEKRKKDRARERQREGCSLLSLEYISPAIAALPASVALPVALFYLERARAIKHRGEGLQSKSHIAITNCFIQSSPFIIFPLSHSLLLPERLFFSVPAHCALLFSAVFFLSSLLDSFCVTKSLLIISLSEWIVLFWSR